MPALRSRTVTHGRNRSGARALWRATGLEDGDFGTPIVAVANSFTQLVPGHVHLRDLGTLVAEAVREAGAIGLIEDGDLVEWRPAPRVRPVSAALRACAAMATSASTGAALDLELPQRT